MTMISERSAPAGPALGGRATFAPAPVPASASRRRASPAPGGERRPRRDLGRVALRVLSVAACVALWQWASMSRVDLGLVTFVNVPAPTEVLVAARELFGSPKLWLHLWSSVLRVLAGFAAAGVTGVVLGLVIGRSRLAEDTLLPPLEVLRPIPGVAWLPLAILMFPSAELSMIFITTMGALFPILLATIHGVGALDPRLIASSRSLGARPFRLFLEVVLPGALPSIITGMSIGMGTSWFCLVTAEMIGGQYGVGYFTWESYNLQRYPDIVLGMLLIGLMGMLSSALVQRIGAWLTPWHRPQEKGR
ncbi:MULTISPECIES: ABC transporter permease [Sorangium]|uniref:ABC transporter permease n=1 Tax=Sorangium cellulosum TaxID=56 RepID=A0A4P2QNJ5_SORCE|nr:MULTISPECIES: ABC transporter permease [Sorangium]AUX31448.1 ABC transporter permease [Sorangium cellulosum]WCQ90827.1 Bicarbonate transport system permease protein CmpB [Sorangium sp. Soce836]